MNQHTISLIDVITPPENRWLKELSRRKADLPIGVRVVRFSDGDDDDGSSDVVVETIDYRSSARFASRSKPRFVPAALIQSP